MHYSYYAVFEYTGDGINITFPDVNTLSCAKDTEEGLYMAQDALILGLHDIHADEIPAPSKLEDICLNDNQTAFLITADMSIRNGKLFSPGVKTLTEEELENWMK